MAINFMVVKKCMSRIRNSCSCDEPRYFKEYISGSSRVRRQFHSFSEKKVRLILVSAGVLVILRNIMTGALQGLGFEKNF